MPECRFCRTVGCLVSSYVSCFLSFCCCCQVAHTMGFLFHFTLYRSTKPVTGVTSRLFHPTPPPAAAHRSSTRGTSRRAIPGRIPHSAPPTAHPFFYCNRFRLGAPLRDFSSWAAQLHSHQSVATRPLRSTSGTHADRKSTRLN